MAEGSGKEERKGKLEVPAEVFRGLEEVRQGGATNMLMWSEVQYWAYQNEAYETVTWLEENSREYVGGCLSGVLVSADGDTERIKREVADKVAAGDVVTYATREDYL